MAASPARLRWSSNQKLRNRGNSHGLEPGVGTRLGSRQRPDHRADSSARVLYVSRVAPSACERSTDRGTRNQSSHGQDASPQSVAFSARLAEGNSRLAVPAAGGVSRGYHRHDYFDDLVDHPERAAGRAGESESDNESGEGAMVFPGPARNAGVLRSVDRRGGDADAH